MKTKLTPAMSGALGVLASKTVATFADLSAVGGSGSSLANLVNNKLAKRVDKGGEKLWSITGDGRKALKSGFYTKLESAAPQAVVKTSPQPGKSTSAPSRTAAKTNAKASTKKAPGKRKLAGV